MSAKFLFLVVFAAGCGSLADGTYYGEPLLSLSGTVITESLDRSFDSKTIGVAMLWTLNIDETDEAQSAVVRTEFPARYTLDLFQPPPSDRRISLLGDEGFQGVVGMPVIYADSNGDGRWDPGSEQVVGGSYSTGILYSDSMPDWFKQVAGEGAESGFVPVPLDRDPCEEGSELRVNDPGQSDLYVGYIAAVLWDWDCDGSDDEWSEDDWSNVENCPSLEVIERECNDLGLNYGEAQQLSGAAAVDEYARLQGVLNEDVIWTNCLEEVCPTVIQGIEAGP